MFSTSAGSSSWKATPPRYQTWPGVSVSTPSARSKTATRSWLRSTRRRSGRPRLLRRESRLSPSNLLRAEAQLVALGWEVSKAPAGTPVERTDVHEAHLFGHPAARPVLASGPQRQPVQVQLVARPVHECARSLGRQATAGVVAADPVVQRRDSGSLAVETRDAQLVALLLLDEDELKHALLAPRLLVAPRHGDAGLQRWLERPRHPREQLGTRRDDRRVQARRVRLAHGLEPKPRGGESYSARGGGADFCPSVRAGPTQTVWMFTNSLIPYSESSRPYPDRFTPPNGRRASEATIPLMNTSPASIRSASFFARSTS